jgi:hypothetical protein
MGDVVTQSWLQSSSVTLSLASAGAESADQALTYVLSNGDTAVAGPCEVWGTHVKVDATGANPLTVRAYTDLRADASALCLYEKEYNFSSLKRGREMTSPLRSF